MIRNPHRGNPDLTEHRGAGGNQPQSPYRGGHVLVAAVTGLTSGAARAAVDWLLQHLSA